ncbi:hypothetical protein MKX03_011932 [Papaver bracteatum]|nr:hypothetical protein MKX03_011932 [Papaver bracteatum]
MSRALQLGRYLCCISITITNLRCFLLVDQSSFSSSPSSSSPAHSYRFLSNQPSLYNRRNFSSSTPPSPSSPPSTTQTNSQGISTELIKQEDVDSLPLNKRFHQWISSSPGFQHTDQTYSYLFDYFGRKKDFKIIHEILIGGRGVIGTKTIETFVNRLVRAGRDTEAVSFFDKMETEYGLVRNRQSLKIVVSNLCENGFANYAEKMVKNLAHEFFPDESTCEILAGEIHRGGFQLGTSAYNSILDCVCKLCRKKDNFLLYCSSFYSCQH